jgi:hypothetical protein
VQAVVEVLVQMDIVVVVVVLVAVAVVVVVATRLTAVILRWTIRVAQVEVHRTLVVSKAVRKVQSVSIALIERVEVREAKRTIRSEETWSPKRRQVNVFALFRFVREVTTETLSTKKTFFLLSFVRELH